MIEAPPQQPCGGSRLMHLSLTLKKQCPDAKSIEQFFQQIWLQVVADDQQIHGTPIGTTWYELLIAYHMLGFKITQSSDRQPAAAAALPSLGKLLRQFRMQVRRVGHAVMPLK